MGTNKVDLGVSLPEMRPTKNVQVSVPAEEADNKTSKAQEKLILEKRRAEEIKQVNKDSVQLVRDEKSGRSYIQVVDDDGEVLYQVPPEELQKLQQLLRHLNGNVVDTLA